MKAAAWYVAGVLMLAALLAALAVCRLINGAVTEPE